MGGFKRITIVLSIFLGASWQGLRGNTKRANEEIFHGFRQLGGVYVKFLQILSLKKIAFLGNWDTKESVAVFDAVRPDDLDIDMYLRKEIRPEFLNDIIHVDKSPFAAGSFGQVYYGQHRDGTPIIVKALRPGLVQNIRVDLRILRVLAYLLGFSLRQWSTDFSAVFKDFRQVILKEIDYKAEAAHAHYFYDYFKHNPQIVIPRTYLELCTDNIIVQEYLPGIPLTEVVLAVDDGLNPHEYVRQRLDSDLTDQIGVLGEEITLSILTADWILGDPHPGNIKLLDNDRIGVYDFGITGEPPNDRQAFLEVLRDYIKLHKDDFEPGEVFIHVLRFFAQDLYRAVNTVAKALNTDEEYDFVEELKQLARTSYQGNTQRLDVKKLLKHGQIGRVMSRTINDRNKFALRIEFDSSVMIRSADGYLNIIDKLGLRDELIPGMFERSLDRLEEMPDVMLTGIQDTMDLESAVDIVSNWVQDMYERDPITFRSFVKKFRGKTARVSHE